MPFFKRSCTQGGRLGDFNWAFVDEAVFGGRASPVERVADGYSLGFCRETKFKRLLMPTAFFTELDLFCCAFKRLCIGLPGGGGEKSHRSIFRLGEILFGQVSEGNVLFLIRIFWCEFVNDRLTVGGY